MAAQLVLAFGTSTVVWCLIAVTVWWIRQPGPEAADDPPGRPRTTCRLHEWEPTEGAGFVCRRCRRQAGLESPSPPAPPP